MTYENAYENELDQTTPRFDLVTAILDLYYKAVNDS